MAIRRQPMMCWSAVRSALRRKFPLEYDDDEGVRLVWHFDGVAQPQWLHHIRSLDVPHVMVMCPIGGEHDIPARDAVRHNSSLAVGAMALGPTGYVMRAVMPLDAVSHATFERILEVLACEAARIRGNINRARESAIASSAVTEKRSVISEPGPAP